MNKKKFQGLGDFLKKITTVTKIDKNKQNENKNIIED